MTFFTESTTCPSIRSSSIYFFRKSISQIHLTMLVVSFGFLRFSTDLYLFFFRSMDHLDALRCAASFMLYLAFFTLNKQKVARFIYTVCVTRRGLATLVTFRDHFL